MTNRMSDQFKMKWWDNHPKQAVNYSNTVFLLGMLELKKNNSNINYYITYYMLCNLALSIYNNMTR